LRTTVRPAISANPTAPEGSSAVTRNAMSSPGSYEVVSQSVSPPAKSSPPATVVHSPPVRTSTRTAIGSPSGSSACQTTRVAPLRVCPPCGVTNATHGASLVLLTVRGALSALASRTPSDTVMRSRPAVPSGACRVSHTKTPSPGKSAATGNQYGDPSASTGLYSNRAARGADAGCVAAQDTSTSPLSGASSAAPATGSSRNIWTSGDVLHTRTLRSDRTTGPALLQPMATRSHRPSGVRRVSQSIVQPPRLV